MHQHRIRHDGDIPGSAAHFTRRLAIRAVPFAAAAMLAFGLAAGPDPALARDNVGAGTASCMYNGVEYSHGSIVKMDNGYYYICNNGNWDFHSSVPRPITQQASTVTLTQASPLAPAAGNLTQVEMAP